MMKAKNAKSTLLAWGLTAAAGIALYVLGYFTVTGNEMGYLVLALWLLYPAASFCIAMWYRRRCAARYALAYPLAPALGCMLCHLALFTTPAHWAFVLPALLLGYIGLLAGRLLGKRDAPKG